MHSVFIILLSDQAAAQVATQNNSSSPCLAAVMTHTPLWSYNEAYQHCWEASSPELSLYLRPLMCYCVLPLHKFVQGAGPVQ